MTTPRKNTNALNVLTGSLITWRWECPYCGCQNTSRRSVSEKVARAISMLQPRTLYARCGMCHKYLGVKLSPRTPRSTTGHP